MVSKKNSLAAEMLQSTIMVKPVSSGIMESFESVGRGANKDSSRKRQRRLEYASPRCDKSQAKKDRKVIYEVVKGSVTIDDQLTTGSVPKEPAKEDARGSVESFDGNKQGLDSPTLGLKTRQWSLTRIRTKDDQSKSRSLVRRGGGNLTEILTAQTI